MQNKTLIIGTIVGSLFASSASAADLLYDPKPAKGATLVYDTGPYVAIRGAVTWPQDASANFGTSPNGVTGSFEDNGWAGDIAAGYAFNNAFGIFTPRVEAELDYSSAQLASGQFFNAGGAVGAPFALDGKRTALGLFGNVLLDLNTGFFGFTPFIGGGVGVADVDIQVNNGGFNVIDDSDTTFAYKLIAGLKYEVKPGVNLELAYSHVTYTDVTVNGVAGLNSSSDQSEDRVGAGFSLSY